MGRIYHSASSAKTGARCRRLWAYQYIDGIREPEVAWELIEAGQFVLPRVRAVSLGKATHHTADLYFNRAPGIAWHRLPGQILASGLGALPSPDDCAEIEVEHSIGTIPLPASPRPDAPSTALLVCGVPWAGFRDLAVRLLISPEWHQVDYKTTGDIARWAMTPAKLQDDLQACVYTIDGCDRWHVDDLHSRWLYLETKRVRRAWPVDVRITRQHAEGIVAPYAALCMELDKIQSSAEAEPNLDACADYGGCSMHITQGGPCTARRTLAARYAQEATKGTKMTIPGDLAKLFGVAPNLPPPPAAPPPPPAPASSFGAAVQPPPPAVPPPASSFGAAVQPPPAAPPPPAPPPPASSFGVPVPPPAAPQFAVPPLAALPPSMTVADAAAAAAALQGAVGAFTPPVPPAPPPATRKGRGSRKAAAAPPPAPPPPPAASPATPETSSVLHLGPAQLVALGTTQGLASQLLAAAQRLAVVEAALDAAEAAYAAALDEINALLGSAE